MKKKQRTLWISETAVFIALLVVLQAATRPLGSTLITGCIVNLLLILSVMLCGLSSGIIVGVVSPVIAKCFGIGPLWSIIPLILLGNVTLALIWHFVGKQKRLRPFSAHILALPLAALAKFAALYLGIQACTPLLAASAGTAGSRYLRHVLYPAANHRRCRRRSRDSFAPSFTAGSPR